MCECLTYEDGSRYFCLPCTQQAEAWDKAFRGTGPHVVDKYEAVSDAEVWLVRIETWQRWVRPVVRMATYPDDPETQERNRDTARRLARMG